MLNETKTAPAKAAYLSILTCALVLLLLMMTLLRMVRFLFVLPPPLVAMMWAFAFSGQSLGNRRSNGCGSRICQLHQI